jgi:hypothetical protein
VQQVWRSSKQSKAGEGEAQSRLSGQIKSFFSGEQKVSQKAKIT